MAYSVVTDYRTTLAAPMTSSQLTMVVNSIVTKDATPHTITTSDMGDGWYLTIEPGGAGEEVVKITAVTPGSGDGGTFTIDPSGRGLAFYGSTDAQGAGNAKAHNPGAVVILSNVKNVYDRLVDRESDEDIGGIKTFLEVPIIPPVPTQPTDAASKAYVDATIMAAGGVTAGYVTQNGADPSLTINVGSGDFIFGNTLVSFAGASAQAVTPSSTNYVQLRGDGTLVINTTGFLGGQIPLAQVTTDGTDITAILDERPFFTQPETVPLVTTALTYGATIAAGDKLYLDTADGKWKLALATSSATADSLFGVALDAGVNNDTLKRVQIGGLVSILSGLTPGFQYLTDLGALSTTPGTYRKLVGFAPTATKLILFSGFRPNDLSGVNSTVTATTLNEAGAFFSTPKTQSIKYTATAGQDLAAGEVVALESDGKVYRTRPTGFSSANVGATSDFAIAAGQQGKMYWFDTSTPTVKCFMGQDIVTAPDSFVAVRMTVDSGYDAIASSALANGSLAGNPGIQDAVQHNSGTQVTIIGRSDTGTVEAISFDGISTSPSFGSALVLETAEGAGITDTETAGVLVGFAGISATELRSYKITFSGTTLTESTNASFVSGTNMIPLAAGRFTGTNFIAVVFANSSTTALRVAVGEYTPSSGTWVSVGTPVDIEASGAAGNETVFIVPVSSTKVAVGYVKGTDVKATVVTRTGTVASVGSILTAISGGGTMTCATFKKLGTYSFFIGAETNAGGKLQIVALDRDLTEFSIIGSPFTNDSVSDRGVAGCLLYPGRWLSMYQRVNNTTMTAATRELSHNIASAIGVIEAAVDADATEEVVTEGYTGVLSGLTAGSPYYTAIDGQLTTSDVGMGVLTTNLDEVAPVKKVLTAVSTTAGIIKSL